MARKGTTQRGSTAYGQLLTTLEALGATRCPSCGDYMIHLAPCLGWNPHFGGGGVNLVQPYRLELVGALEAEEIEAETLNQQAA